MLNTPLIVCALLSSQLDEFGLDVPTVGTKATEIAWEPIQELSASFSTAQFISSDGETTDPAPFVSVCGVVRCSKQIDAIIKALNVEKSSATKGLEVIDFTIQRQEYPAQGKQLDDMRFGSNWESLSMQPAIEFLTVLKDSDTDPIADFHNDDALDSVKHIAHVITMPVPQRAKGQWGQEVTHKSLSKESKDILFRFLDTQVEEGKTYRYRVQLEFRNPVHSASRWELGADPFLSLGQTRLSPWSQPSRAVVCTDESVPPE